LALCQILSGRIGRLGRGTSWRQTAATLCSVDVQHDRRGARDSGSSGSSSSRGMITWIRRVLLLKNKGVALADGRLMRNC
jgi:hypothetical protein